MNPDFRMTDSSNSIHIMSFRGAGRNASQTYQLVDMRDLILDPQGQTIYLPIQSNMRSNVHKGLSLIERILSWLWVLLYEYCVEVIRHIFVHRNQLWNH